MQVIGWPPFFRYIITHRRFVLITAACALLLALFAAKDLRIIVETNEMLPNTHPYVQGSRQITDTFGLKYSLVIGVQNTKGKIDDATLTKVAAITHALKQTPAVVADNIVSLSSRKAKQIQGTSDGLDVKPLMGANSNAQSVIAAVEQTPLFQRMLLSDDKSTAFIIAEYRSAPKGYREIMRVVDPMLNQYRNADTKIYTGGFVRLMAETENYSDRVALLLCGSIIIIALLLFAAFRTRQAMLIPLMTGLLTVVFMLGIMGAVGIPLDVFNAIAPILILAVVAGHSVQVLKRYYEEYQALPVTLDPIQANHEAIVRALAGIAPVTLCAGLAAALGFFSLIVFQIQTVWVFGVMAGTAILIGLLLELTFIPALRASLSPPALTLQQNSKLMEWLKRLSHYAAHIVIQHSGRIFVCCALVVALSLWGASQIRVDNANKRNFSEETAVSKDDKILNTQLAGTNTLYVMLDGGYADAVKQPEFMATLEAVQQALAKEPSVGKAVSMADHLKRLYQALNEDNPAFYRLPDSQDVISQILFLYSMAGDPDDFNAFVDSPYQRASIAVFLKDDSSVTTGAIIAKIRSVISQKMGNQVKVSFGGSLPEAYAINEVMVHDKLFNMAQVITVVWLVAALMFRSLFAGFLVVVPVLMAILVNFGLMGWRGTPLNIPTSLCAAMVVGIGADYGIYLLYRWREYVRQGMTVDAALQAMMPNVGAACLIVALAIATGYAVLIFSSGFLPHHWMGVLIVTAMLVSVLMALTLVPALVRLFQPAFLCKPNS